MKTTTTSKGFKSISLLILLSLLTACGGGSSGGSTPTPTPTPDTTAPVITLTGDNPQTINQGAAYIELGATAQDNVNGNISSSISIDASAVDTNTVGSYSVTYNVSDTAGNAATTQTRTVNVVDILPPIITLVGANPQTIEVSTTYTELGATAEDNVDGNITANISIDASAVDTNTVGSYNVTYNVSDAAGNAATAQTRTVNVMDTTLPIASIGFPTKTGVTDAATITVRGTANDASGVSGVEVNGVEAISDDGFANWWAKLPLTTGENPVSLKVTDTVGNQFEDATALAVKRSVVWSNPKDIAFDSANNRALVVDSNLDAVIAVDLASGIRTIISGSGTGNGFITGSGFNFRFPQGIALDSANNRVLVVEAAFDSQALFAVDLNSGNRTIISNSSTGSGMNFSRPLGIVLDSLNNRVLMTDSGLQALFAVDLVSGNRTIVSAIGFGTGPTFSSPEGIVLHSANNRVLVIDPGIDVVFAVDLVSGNRTAFSSINIGSGPNFSSPQGIALDSINGRVLVTDVGLDAVIAVDLNTGNRTIISEDNDTGPSGIFKGPNFTSPFGIAIENSLVLVTDTGLDALFRVDLNTGNRVIVADSNLGSGSSFIFPLGITLDSGNNSVLVTDIDLDAVITVDLASGNRTILSDDSIGTGTNFNAPAGIALDNTNNRVLVTDFGLDALFAVNLSSGNRTIISDNSIGTGANFDSPQGIVLDSDNNRVLVLDSALDAVIEVDLTSGNRTILSDSNTGSGINLVTPIGIAFDSINNRVLVTDVNLNAVIAVDLSSGNRTIFSDSNTGTGPDFISPSGITLDSANNRVLVIEPGADAVIAVNLGSRNRTILSDSGTGSGPNFINLRGIALDSANNRVLVTDISLDAVFAIDTKPNPNINPISASGDRIVLSK